MAISLTCKSCGLACPQRLILPLIYKRYLSAGCVSVGHSHETRRDEICNLRLFTLSINQKAGTLH